MTPDRFRRRLETYGADIDRWPLTDRQAARACLVRHPDLLVPMAQAATLDASIRRIAPAVSQDAVAAAIDAVERRVKALPANAPWPAGQGVGWAAHQTGAFGWSVAALAGAAAILVAIGLQSAPPPPSDSAAAVALLFDADLFFLSGDPR